MYVWWIVGTMHVCIIQTNWQFQDDSGNVLCRAFSCSLCLFLEEVTPAPKTRARRPPWKSHSLVISFAFSCVKQRSLSYRDKIRCVLEEFEWGTYTDSVNKGSRLWGKVSTHYLYALKCLWLPCWINLMTTPHSSYGDKICFIQNCHFRHAIIYPANNSCNSIWTLNESFLTVLSHLIQIFSKSLFRDMIFFHGN